MVVVISGFLVRSLKGGSKLRTFIAIDTGKGVASVVDMVVDKLKRMGFKASWVPGSNAHLTLSFLGEIEFSKVEILASMLSKRLRGFPSFTFSTKQLGFFRHNNLPRVIWIGVENTPFLNNLHREVRVALGSLGLAAEDKFHPHITVGRMKYSPPYWKKLLATIELEEIVVPVNGVHIYESELLSEGANYRKIFSCNFEGGLVKHEF